MLKYFLNPSKGSRASSKHSKELEDEVCNTPANSFGASWYATGVLGEKFEPSFSFEKVPAA